MRHACSNVGRPMSNGMRRILGSWRCNIIGSFLLLGSKNNPFCIVRGTDNKIIAALWNCSFHSIMVWRISSRNWISPCRRNWDPILIAFLPCPSCEDCALPCPFRTVYRTEVRWWVQEKEEWFWLLWLLRLGWNTAPANRPDRINKIMIGLDCIDTASW